MVRVGVRVRIRVRVRVRVRVTARVTTRVTARVTDRYMTVTAVSAGTPLGAGGRGPIDLNGVLTLTKSHF